MKAIPVEYLYSRFNGESISILGAARGLNEELKEYPPNGVAIALNSAFLAHPSYTIHWVANQEFINQFRNKFTGKGICIKPNSFPPLGYSEEFFYFPSRATEGVIDKNNSFLVAHSCLVPALHFALRCKPSKISLYGIDLTTANHWFDKTQRANQFPAWRKVCHEVKNLLTVFNYTNIFCLNSRSALVLKRIVKHGN